MIKVLIFGGGFGAAKFIQSLSFFNEFDITLTSFRNNGNTRNLARKSKIKFQAFEYIDESQRYDVLVISVQPENIYNVLYTLYNKTKTNNIIIDKPLAIELNVYNMLIDFINKHSLKVLTGYNRRFDKINYKKYIRDEYIIKYPAVEGINNIVHNIPHMLDWLIYIENNEIKIDNYLLDENEHIYTLTGYINDKLFHIILDKENKQFTLNNKEVDMPTLMSNYGMIDYIINNDICKVNKLLKKDKNITEILEVIKFDKY